MVDNNNEFSDAVDPFAGAVDPFANEFAGAVDPFAGAVDPFAESGVEEEPTIDRTWGEVGTDTVASIGGGFANLGGGIVALSDTLAQTGNLDIDIGARELFDNSAKFWEQQKSASMKQAKERLEKGEGVAGKLKAIYKNPELVGDLVAGSLPYLLPTGAASRVGLAINGAKGATLATAGTGAVLEASDSGSQAYNDVLDLTPEQLFSKSEPYAELRKTMDHKEAIDKLAYRSGLTATAVTLPIAFLAGKFSGAAKLESDFFTGTGTRDLLTGVTKEGVEEFIQEGGNRFGRNIAAKVNTNSDQEAFEGVAEDGIVGTVAGVAQAGGMRAVTAAGDEISKKKQADAMEQAEGDKFDRETVTIDNLRPEDLMQVPDGVTGEGISDALAESMRLDDSVIYGTDGNNDQSSDQQLLSNEIVEGPFESRSVLTAQDDSETPINSERMDNLSTDPSDVEVSLRPEGYEKGYVLSTLEQKYIDSKNKTGQKTDEELKETGKLLAELRKDTSKGKPDSERQELQRLIARLGGISTKDAEAQGIDKAQFKDKVGKNNPFRKDGVSFDEMAEKLDQYGFFIDEPYSANGLLDMLGQSIAGNDVYAAEGQEHKAKIDALMQQEDDLSQAGQRLTESFGELTPDEEIYMGEMFSAYLDGASMADIIEVMDSIDHTDANGSEFFETISLIGDLTNVAKQADSKAGSVESNEIRNEADNVEAGSSQESQGQERELTLEEAFGPTGLETSTQADLGTDQNTDASAQDQTEVPASESTDAVAPPLELEQQTEQQAQDKAEADAVALAKDKADKKAAEDKAAADTEAKDFKLSGSDSDADIAAAGGQNSLFDAPTTTDTEQRSTGQRDIYNDRTEGKTPEELVEYIDELRNDANVNEKTGLGSNKSWVSRKKKAFVASIDLDSLKWINDNMGHDVGDKALKLVADAFAKAGIKKDAYHVSGDEFYVQGDSESALKGKLKIAQSWIANQKLESKGFTIDGPSFSFGIGNDVSTAETSLNESKTEREQNGQRAGRGERPNSVTQATGSDNKQGRAGADNKQTESNEAPVEKPVELKADKPKEKPAKDKTEKSKPTQAEKDSKLFANNKVFTVDKVAEARARLKSKLSQLNSGIDPEVVMDGITLTGAYVEGGIRDFSKYASLMIEDFGDAIKPFLRSFWDATRSYPSIDTQGMTSAEQTEKLHNDLISGKAEKNLSLYDLIDSEFDNIRTNNEFKKIIAGMNDIKVADVSEADIKQAQELYEAIIVEKARDIVAEGLSDSKTYDKLTELYANQPNLNSRSSTSVENQAYSTPAPLAFLASRLAGIDYDSKVYEPTAGNGMLLIGASIDNSSVNELNDERVENLKKIGYSPTQNDATTFVPALNAFDSVIMNPPFGSLDKAVKVDGFTIKKIDHLIAAKSLEAIKDGGRSTIIIGANKKSGVIGAGDKTFFNWLYSHYNVVDHFEVNGDLYKRQGAGWPVRVITVAGRQESSTMSPPSGSIERYDNWSEIYEHYTNAMDTIGQQPERSSESSVISEQETQVDDGLSQSVGGQTGVGTKQGDTKRNNGGTGSSASDAKSSGNAQRPNGNSGNTNTGGGTSKPVLGSGPKPENKTDTNTGTKESSDAKSDDTRANEQPISGKSRVGGKASEFQAEYVTVSGGSNEGVLTPLNMAESTQKALENIEEAVGGSLDQYVADKLGYKNIGEVIGTPESIKAGINAPFMGLQVDTIAAAIYNIEERQRGIIIADQTGVGKGRQAAGIIRYAIESGKIPIFVTVKPNLFGDMFRDSLDIGLGGIKPFISAQKEGINHGGDILFKNSTAVYKNKLQQIIDTNDLPSGHNALFTTYDQLKGEGAAGKPNPRRKMVDALVASGRAIFVLDESHNAAGEFTKVKKIGGVNVEVKTTAGYVSGALENADVVYLSATYAKRPDNMPVYHKTDLMDAVDSAEELIEAMARGGVPIQQIASSMLAANGQLFRRERSFEGIDIPMVIDTENTAEHEVLSNDVNAGLREVVTASSAFMNIFMEDYADDFLANNGEAIKLAGNKAQDAAGSANPFTSVVHNYIRQMLLSLKVDTAAEMAIASHKKGVKPVIALETTMGAMLADYIARNDLKSGDVINFGFNDVMLVLLERSRRVSVKDAKGDSVAIQVELHELDELTREVYIKAEESIRNIDLSSLPASPIDYMLNKMRRADIVVDEITGRQWAIDYSGEKPRLKKINLKSASEKTALIDSFNDGETNGLILNISGSTGLSIHASEKFKDTKPRHMIVAQPMLDINVLMQMLGRINRTGQVEFPQYSILSLDLPAEKRPNAILMKKLAQLNANTSANDKSDTSLNAPDFINKYGDEVVNDWLNDNGDVNNVQRLTGVSPSEKNAEDGFASKFTGKLALLDVAIQRSVYDELLSAYNDKIEYLNSVGQNDLVSQTLALDAFIIDSKIVHEGKDKSSMFAGDTTLHKVNAKYMGKPPLPKEVNDAIEGSLKGKDASDIARDLITKKDKAGAKLIKTIEDKIVSARKSLAEAEAKLKAFKVIEGDKVSENKANALNSAVVRVASEVRVAEEQLKAFIASKGKSSQLLSEFTIGKFARLDLGDEEVTGVVVAVKDGYKNGVGSPYALSKTKVTFMVNSGARQISLPMSKLLDPVLVLRTMEGDIDRVFNTKYSDIEKRETRYIATGNLIAGMAKLAGARVVLFTDNSGNNHEGLMMPRKFGRKGEFEGGNLTVSFAVRDSEAAARYVKISGTPATVGLYSSDKAVKISEGRDGSLVINVPTANKNKAARSVKLDKELRSIVGDFFGRGKFSSAKVPAGKESKAIKRVLEIMPLYAPNNQRDEYIKVGGESASSAVMSFDGVTIQEGKAPEMPLEMEESQQDTEIEEQSDTKLSANLELWETTHTKTNAPVFMVGMKDRVSRDEYKRLNGIAKDNGGYYSRYGRAGFLFSSESDRAGFVEAVGGPTAAFSRSSGVNNQPVTKNQANKVVNRIISKWKGSMIGRKRDFVVVDSFDQLPSVIKQQATAQGAANEIEGVYYDGKVYLVRDKLYSEADIERVIFHESYGHDGLRKLFGKELVQKLNQLYIAIGGEAGLDAMAAKYGINLDAYKAGLDSAVINGKLSVDQRNRIMVDELLAHIQQSNKPSIKRLAKEILGMIRQFFRKLGYTGIDSLSDNEIFVLLRNARDAVVDNATNQGGSQASFMMAGANFSRSGKEASNNIDEGEIVYAGTNGDKVASIVPYGESRPSGRNLFGGVFGSFDKGVASSHGDNIQEFVVRNHVDHDQLRSDVFYDEKLSSLANKEFKDILIKHKGVNKENITDSEIAELLDYTMGDKSLIDDLPDMGLDRFNELMITNSDSIRSGETDWDFQGIKGELGRRLGYDSIGMPDENGESVLVLNGLPMDKASRMQRAKELGFDTSLVLYHGTRSVFTEFDDQSFMKTGMWGDGVNLTTEYSDAEKYSSDDIYVNHDRQGKAEVLMQNFDLSRDDAYTLLDKGSDSPQVMELYTKTDNLLALGYDDLKIDMRAMKQAYIEASDLQAFEYLERWMDRSKRGGKETFERIMRGDSGGRIFRQYASLKNKDGLKISSEFAPRSEGGDHYLILNPKNIRSVDAVFDPSKADESDIMFSRSGNNDSDMETIAKRVLATPISQVPIVKRVKQWISDHVDRRYLREGFVDQFDPIAALEKNANEGNLRDAKDSAYKAAAFSKNANTVLELAMHVGGIKLENGGIVVNENVKGLMELLSPLAEANLVREWELWAGAKRADRLLSEGKERNYSESDIQAINEMMAEQPEKLALFKSVHKDWVAYNKSLLDFGEAAGLIDPDSRELWENDDYVPFHRVSELEDTPSPTTRPAGGLSGQKAGIQKLTGGVQKISIVESMVRNSAHMIEASMKNIAMQRTIELAEEFGTVEKVSDASISDEEAAERLDALEVDYTDSDFPIWKSLLEKNDARHGTVTVSVDGKTERYLVKDEALLRAMSSLGGTGLENWLRVLRIPKTFLTTMVTSDPSFALRNLMRDTLSTWVAVHTDNREPVSDAIKGVVKSLKNDETQQAMRAQGVGGGGFYDSSPDGARRYLDRLNADAGIADTIVSGWEGYRKILGSTENANRIAVYDNVIASGGTKAEAAYQSMDVLNFTRHGSLKPVRILIELVPFLNARIQGLDKLHRGAKEGTTSWKEMNRDFMLKGSILMGATLALLADNWDNEDYWDLDEWDRDTYYHVFLEGEHYRIPKPFEVGSLFSTVPERMFEQMRDDADAKLLGQRMLHMVKNTFAFDPTPQIIRPMIEVGLNENGFTGRTILSRGMEYASPQMQYNAYTSATFVELAKLMPESATDALKSPIRLEYLFKGYFGTLGSYGLLATDAVVRDLTNAAVRPALRKRDIPVVKSFVRDGVGTNKHVGRTYEMSKKISLLHSDLRKYAAEGNQEKVQNLIKTKGEKLKAKAMLDKATNRMGEIGSQMKAIYDNRTMTAEEKRIQIDRLMIERNTIAKTVSLKAAEFF